MLTSHNTGWTTHNVDFKTFAYSSSEIVVGKWTNGKLIYQRVITGTITAVAGVRDITVRNDLTGIESMVNMYGYLDYGGGLIPFGATQAAGTGGTIQKTSSVMITNSNITIISISDAPRTSSPYAFVIEYTKV